MAREDCMLLWIQRLSYVLCPPYVFQLPRWISCHPSLLLTCLWPTDFWPGATGYNVTLMSVCEVSILKIDQIPAQFDLLCVSWCGLLMAVLFLTEASGELILKQNVEGWGLKHWLQRLCSPGGRGTHETCYIHARWNLGVRVRMKWTLLQKILFHLLVFSKYQTQSGWFFSWVQNFYF